MSKPNLPRFIIVTGKGGVGKTTCALSLTYYLQNTLGVKAVYLTHQLGTLRRQDPVLDQNVIMQTCQELQLPYNNLKLKDCLTEYIAQKLGSSLIADWIVKTKFFSALVEIIPGFSQLIYMGRILQDLRNDPQLHYVLDAAATGHALSLIESIYNFQKIFSIGPLHQDTQMLKDFFTQKGLVKIVLMSIPQELSINEFQELEKNLKQIDPKLSCSLNLNQHFASSNFPKEMLLKTQYWLQKYQDEEKLAASLLPEWLKIPLVAEFSLTRLVPKLANSVPWEQSL